MNLACFQKTVTRAHKGECCFRRTESGTFVPCMGSRRTTFGARRMTHDGKCWFQHTKSETFFVYVLYGSSSLRTNQNRQNITFVSAQKSWLCYLYLRISTVLHLLNFRRDNFSTKIWKFFWGILLAQICPAHGARRTAHENVAFWIIAVRYFVE